MAISFACPGCKTLVQVGEELAGQTGQCPRCQKLIVIPSAQTPLPMLLDEQGRPVPPPPPTPSAPRRDRPAALPLHDDDLPRSRRAKPAPKQPTGPVWPWAVGICGAILIFILLFASFITLFTYRPSLVKSNLIVVEPRSPFADRQTVTVGRLDGNVASLEDGVFQVRSAITPDDPIDGGDGVRWGARCKTYVVALRPHQRYLIEVQSKQFSCSLRIQDGFGNHIHREGFLGNRLILIQHTPWRPEQYILQVTSLEGVPGDFTLTIREDHRPKPVVP